MNYNSEIKRIIIAPWPDKSLNFNIDQETVDYVEGKFDLIRIGRILRSDYNLNIKQEAKFFIHSKNKEIEKRILKDKDSIMAAIKASSLDVGMNIDNGIVMPSGISKLGDLYMSIKGIVDIESEVLKTEKELIEVNSHLNNIHKKLNNMNFVERAPKNVVEKQKLMLIDLNEKNKKLTLTLEMLKKA